MDRINTRHSRLANKAHTIALIAAMAGLLGALGWFIAGLGGIKLALFVTVLTFIFSPRLPAGFVMARLGARPLSPAALPGLHRITAQLSARAGLDTQPRIYYLPSSGLNAFAVGDRADAGIAVTHGLISALTPREMAGILSHEMTHIKNNDTQVMALSAVFARLTHWVSFLGQILLLLSLPLALIGRINPPLFAMALMVFAPALSFLLHQALSRTREFEADLGSSVLLKDPRALASALAKVEASRTSHWARRFLPVPVQDDPAPLLQSHPPTDERIRRLLALDPPPRVRPQPGVLFY